MGILESEKGVTLIEVLASITLLSIVLITIMNIFPQMGMINNHNQIKTQAVNTAKEILLEWQNDNDRIDNFFKTPDVLIISEYAPLPGDAYNFETVEGDYFVNIKINKTPSKESTLYNAHLIVIRLYDINKRDTLVSETYGYVKVGS